MMISQSASAASSDGQYAAVWDVAAEEVLVRERAEERLVGEREG
ncbi:hypothetical protein [Flindersiella endophytica]